MSASTGNSARGIPNTIAMMSITNVDCSTWRPRRNANPSFTARHPTAARSPSEGGIGRIEIEASSNRPIEIRSIAYAHENPKPATTIPASAGPIRPAPFQMIWLSAAAAGSWVLSSRRGVIALRVGLSIALVAAMPATAT